MFSASANRQSMNQALMRRVLPALREQGFKGSFPHFRRQTRNQTELVTFQFSMAGGAFVVEVAKCPSGDLAMEWGEVIPANKISAHHLNYRLRLGTNHTQSDHWFKFGNFDPANEAKFNAVAESVLPFLSQQAEHWWASEETGFEHK